MSCRVVVAKLGGSVITVKDSPETVNWDSLDALVSQVHSFTSSGGRMALVLGGGSFGHYTVSRILSRKESLGVEDAPSIQLSMMKLGLAFLSSAIERGVRATLHPPHTFCTPSSCNFKPLARDLDNGLTPVTYGDAVLGEGSISIVSGDDLAVDMAWHLSAECLFYVVDTGGVISADGRVLRELGEASFVERGGQRRGWDVTGGMSRKIKAALRAPSTTLVRIIGAQDLLRAIRGEPVGTLIRARSAR